MIKNFVMCMIFVVSMGCTTIVELSVNAIGGALGNMIDRRVEDKLGNDAGLSDEKLEPKLKKENDDECEDCKDDKW
jgi:hypothetical protein